MNLVENNLSGVEILGRIQKGHVVRRACWVDGVYIRICNECGYDEQGNVIFDDRNTHLYTICTTGYFLHLGYSSQPFKKPRTFVYGNYGIEVASRDGEGIGMLFATDWEDYGFMSADDYDAYREENQEAVKAAIKAEEIAAVERA
jgi:hypothetical protein